MTIYCCCALYFILVSKEREIIRSKCDTKLDLHVVQDNMRGQQNDPIPQWNASPWHSVVSHPLLCGWLHAHM